MNGFSGYWQYAQNKINLWLSQANIRKSITLGSRLAFIKERQDNALHGFILHLGEEWINNSHQQRKSVSAQAPQAGNVTAKTLSVLKTKLDVRAPRGDNRQS